MIHLGAISDTTASDGDLVVDTNFRLSLRLLDWCTSARTPFIYASSAATYGDGAQGFADDWSLPALRRLRPLNLYGWSKHLFDLALVDRRAKKEKLPPQWAGLKFFNVFGPNEYHKGAMASVLARVFDEAKAGRPVRLFKSHREGIADGDQRRDFIFVDDAVAVVRWLHRAAVDLRHLQRRHRAGAQLPRHDRSPCSRRSSARRTSNTSPCRRKSATSISISRKAAVENLRRAGYNAGFTLARGRGEPLRHAVPRSGGPLPVKTGAGTMFSFEKVLSSLGGQTVLCIGDLMLDDFVYGDVLRISPEAPAPVIAVKREEIVIGGAGNVARNVASLGARCIFVGVIGDDPAGKLLRSGVRRVQALDRAAPRGRSRAADHAQAALRVRAFLDPPAARRLGSRRSRSSPRSKTALIERATAALPRGRRGGALRLRQGRAHPNASSAP